MNDTPPIGCLDTLGAWLAARATTEDGTTCFGKPDRWWDDATWRCAEGHVSKTLLGTHRGHVCLGCGGQVWLTFPEDVEALTGTGDVWVVAWSYEDTLAIYNDGVFDTEADALAYLDGARKDAMDYGTFEVMTMWDFADRLKGV